MRIPEKVLRQLLILIGISLYLSFIITKLSFADPSGADVTNLSTETYSVSPDPRQDLGGTITTVSLSTTQQDSAWKAYVGNITGTLVLRNSDGWSIFEWALNNSALSGNVFVSRNGSVDWDNIRCANNTIIGSEQSFLGMATADSDNINRTFNYTKHKTMTIGGVGTISNSTCPSAATYVNGSAQAIDESSYFQEVLLYDRVNLVYGTFIDQNTWGYENNESGGGNVTYDFQLLVAENGTAQVGTVYYFYADISG